jgi:hypothetical protein
MYDPNDDDDCEYVSAEEMAEIEAGLIADGFVTADGKVDWEALHAQPGVESPEFNEMLEAYYASQETDD